VDRSRIRCARIPHQTGRVLQDAGLAAVEQLPAPHLHAQRLRLGVVRGDQARIGVIVSRIRPAGVPILLTIMDGGGWVRPG
jgi:hypothetical protein